MNDGNGVSVSLVSASYQKFSLIIMGMYTFFSSLVFYYYNPTEYASIGTMLLLVGPAVGMFVIVKSQSIFNARGADVNPAPYIGGFAGVSALCLLAALYIEQWWFVGMLLVVSSMVVGFLAWFEQSGIGMSAAISMSAMAAIACIAGLGSGAFLVSLLFSAMLFTAVLALK